METKKHTAHLKLTAVAVLAVLSLAACCKKTIKANTDASTAPINTPIPLIPEERDNGPELYPVRNMNTIYFGYDSADLSQDALEQLEQNLKWARLDPGLMIYVEGHCDARGTTSYNLALGERRAMSIVRYYTIAGIDPKRIVHISYGKERPACDEETEECWSRCRRVDSTLSGVVKSETRPANQ